MAGKPSAPGDRRLLQVIDEAMANAADMAARAGDRLACRPGCTGCCHGPFPINGLDARRLRSGLERLDPARAQVVRERALAQIPILETDLPDDFEGEEAEAYFTRHAALPCPALDPETGRCDLYEHRPLSCRTFGPPVRIGEADLPPCDLCFVGSSQEEIDACRVEPDPDGVEDRLVRRFGLEAETLIAFALIGK